MGKKTGQTKRLINLLTSDECCVDCPPISEDEGNIIECRAGKLFAEAAPFALNTINSNSVIFNGDGSPDNPLSAESASAPIQNGIISGGEVTWIEDYTYSVSPATYAINGIIYNSPYTEVTLDPADVTNNRIDVFALTSSNTAINITGTPSTNPEQPSIDTATQLIASFALVVANTTSPVGLSQEYIYRENAGTPTEWAASATGGIVVNSITNPNNGTINIEGTAVATGNAITLIRIAPVTLAATKNVLIFYIRSKATWNNNRRLNFQFRNGVTNVGLSVPFGNGLYGFDSSVTGTYQRIVIPFSDFSLTPSDSVDRLIITASGNGGTLGFYIDDIDTQGAYIPAAPTGTTDNVGVFYVNKNYSGIAGANVTGYTIGAISSTNGGYNAQLTAARMGDMNKAYPCPWSARNAAMTEMAAGTITKAYIRVIGGNKWTYGSNVAASNGGEGLTVVATVADIGFTNANSTDVSSLLKNNIFYHFEDNTELTAINRTYAIRVGYNVSLTDVPFRSGMWGKLNVNICWGDSLGLSQRFIEVDNANADITFEGNRFVGQRAPFYANDNIGKLNVKLVTFIGTSQTGPVYIEHLSPREGDGTDMVVNYEIENCLIGKKYFPYAHAATGGTRSTISFGGWSTARKKVFNFKCKNMRTHGYGSERLWSTVDALNWINHDIHINIDYFKHEVDQTNIPTSTNNYALCAIKGQLRQNNSITINIGELDTECSWIDPRLQFDPAGTSINNNIRFNIGYAYKRANYGTILGDTLFELPANNQVLAGEKIAVEYNVGKAVVQTGYVFAENSTFWSPSPVTYNFATVVRGTYITKSAHPCVMLNWTGNAALFQDCVLVSKGAATNTIEKGGGTPAIYTKDVVANLPYEAGITQQGTLTVDANIANYL